MSCCGSTIWCRAEERKLDEELGINSAPQPKADPFATPKWTYPERKR